MQFLHTLGLTMTVGLSAVLALRLIGFASRIPMPPLARYYPLIWTGFWLALASGVVLFMADATTMGTNPVFGLKLLLVAAALGLTAVIHRRVLRPHANPKGRPPTQPVLTALGLVSLFLWLAAIAAGRLTSYVGGVPGEPGLTNTIFHGALR